MDGSMNANKQLAPSTSSDSKVTVGQVMLWVMLAVITIATVTTAVGVLKK